MTTAWDILFHRCVRVEKREREAGKVGGKVGRRKDGKEEGS